MASFKQFKKTREKLRLHDIRTKILMKERGMSREDASKQAFNEIAHPMKKDSRFTID